MKKLILLESAPELSSGALSFSVTVFNIEEIISQFKDIDSPLVLYIKSNVSVSYLLKLVEDYTNDLTVYFNGVTTLMFMSRFDSIEKWTKPVRSEFPKFSKTEKRFQEVKNIVRSK